MFKRIILFVVTNIAILAVISIILSIFNVQPYLTKQGINYESLLIYAAIVGFAGSFTSLFLSKWLIKRAFSIHIIESPQTETESWLYSKVNSLSAKAGISMPEVGIYNSQEPNAFATGWQKNSALVAVSTGLLRVMNQDEVEGVLGHEVSHVANGDMVTLALIQGVVNTFVIFFARIAAFVVTNLLSRGENNRQIGGLAYYGIAIVFEIIFGVLASMIVMAFSRWREYRADEGSAKLTNPQTMIAALRRLQQYSNTPEDNRSPAFAAFKISRRGNIYRLFSSHPPLEKRIAALQRL